VIKEIFLSSEARTNLFDHSAFALFFAAHLLIDFMMMRTAIACQDSTFDPDHQDTGLNPIEEELASIPHKNLFCTIDFLL
jgi:hypothetical protein